MSAPIANVEIRHMTAEDVPRVMEIAAGLPQAPHDSRETWLKLLDAGAAPPRLALVAGQRSSGVLMGFSVVSLLPPQAELESIAVEDASQRRGTGRRLLLAAIDELRKTGVRELWLEVRVSNHAAIGLYRSLGFVESGRRARYYADPVEDAVLMSLALA